MSLRSASNLDTASMRIVIAATLALLLSWPISARTADLRDTSRNLVVQAARELVVLRRYAEARNQLLQFQHFLGKMGATSTCPDESIDRAFSEYMGSVRHDGQRILLWLFEIVPLTLCAVAIAVAIKNRTESAQSLEDRDAARLQLYATCIAVILVASFYVGSITFHLFPQFFSFSRMGVCAAGRIRAPNPKSYLGETCKR